MLFFAHLVAMLLHYLNTGGKTMRNGVTRVLITWLVLVPFLSCGKRRAEQPAIFNEGVGLCGNILMGDFDVILQRSTSYPGLFKFTVITITAVAAGGQYVKLAITNKNEEYVELAPYRLLRPNTVLYSGYLEREDLELYDLMVIAPYVPGAIGFFNSESNRDEVICEIPTTDTSATSTTTSQGYGL